MNKAELQSQYAKALDVATKYHQDQVDLAKIPYIEHLIRVANRFDCFVHKTIAVLHDAIEDTDITIEHLKEMGFDETIIDVVGILTFDPVVQTRSIYIREISQHPIAAVIKMADLRDNMDLTRIAELTEGHIRRLKRYHDEYSYIQLNYAQLIGRKDGLNNEGN